MRSTVTRTDVQTQIDRLHDTADKWQAVADDTRLTPVWRAVHQEHANEVNAILAVLERK